MGGDYTLALQTIQCPLTFNPLPQGARRLRGGGNNFSFKEDFVGVRKYWRAYIATAAASISLQAQGSKPAPTEGTLFLTMAIKGRGD